MGMAAILFSGAEPFDQIVNTPSKEGPMWNLVKIGQAVSEKTFKDYAILYLYIAQGQGHIMPGGGVGVGDGVLWGGAIYQNVVSYNFGWCFKG